MAIKTIRPVFFSLIFVSLALSPVSVSADVCDENGATVVFVNGILGDENSARNDKDLLRRQFLDRGGNKDVEFTNGFNPSHLKVFGDLTTISKHLRLENSTGADNVNILSAHLRSIQKDAFPLFAPGLFPLPFSLSFLAPFRLNPSLNIW